MDLESGSESDTGTSMGGEPSDINVTALRENGENEYFVFSTSILKLVSSSQQNTHEAGHSINTEKCFRCQPAKKYGNIQYAL